MQRANRGSKGGRGKERGDCGKGRKYQATHHRTQISISCGANARTPGRDPSHQSGTSFLLFLHSGKICSSLFPLVTPRTALRNPEQPETGQMSSNATIQTPLGHDTLLIIPRLYPGNEIKADSWECTLTFIRSLLLLLLLLPCTIFYFIISTYYLHFLFVTIKAPVMSHVFLLRNRTGLRSSVL